MKKSKVWVVKRGYDIASGIQKITKTVIVIAQWASGGATPPVAVPAAEPAAGPVLDIPFYEGSGGTAHDLSGNDNHGTITDATWTTGKQGYALDFNGSSAYVDCGNDASLNITDAITVEAWVKGDPQGNTKVVSHYDYGASQRAFYMGISATGNKFNVVLSDDGTYDAGHRKYYASSITVVDNTWHHIAFTFTGAEGVLKLFVDGVEDTNPTKTSDDAITSIHPSTGDVLVGADLNNGVAADFFNGTIDEVRIYNRALSAEEIKDRYDATK